MKFWSQKFPRQARLRSEKSLNGSRWASRQKKFLRNQKTQELFRGKPSQKPRRRPNVRQANQSPRRLSRCPPSEPEPQAPVQVSAKRTRDPGAVQMSAKRARAPGTVQASATEPKAQVSHYPAFLPFPGPVSSIRD